MGTPVSWRPRGQKWPYLGHQDINNGAECLASVVRIEWGSGGGGRGDGRRKGSGSSACRTLHLCAREKWKRVGRMTETMNVPWYVTHSCPILLQKMCVVSWKVDHRNSRLCLQVFMLKKAWALRMSVFHLMFQNKRNVKLAVTPVHRHNIGHQVTTSQPVSVSCLSVITLVVYYTWKQMGKVALWGHIGLLIRKPRWSAGGHVGCRWRHTSILLILPGLSKGLVD